jgi:hypothetical protein
MPTNRRIFRLAAATAAGVVLAGAVAAPAFAEDVIGVTLSSTPSNFTVGSRADTFVVSLRNNTNGIVAAVNVSFTIKLTGLAASQVRIRGTSGDISLNDSGGLVTGTDPRSLDFLPRQRGRDVGYSIEFLSGAPSGRATFTAAATRSGQIQGSASTAINVKGGAVVQSPTPSASPTDPASPDNGSIVPPTGTGNAVGPLANNNQIPVDSGGIPVALYVMGAILVGVGGVILWMLFKQRPEAATPAGLPTGFPTGEFDSPPPNLGYPVGRASAPSSPPGPPSASSANLQPTAPLPAVRNPALGNRDTQPLNPPPPVDPWATRGGGGRPRHGAD